MIIHPIPPLYDENSKVLILGSFPSVKSREAQFFYGHPQNRFWKVMAAVFHERVPDTVSEKRDFLLRNHVALWDVIHSCEIVGSSDSSIKNVMPNDLSIILDASHIERVFVNGKTAEKYYKKYIEKTLGIKAFCLPSTSPANASWSIDRLINVWKVTKWE
ncbi:G/U mismatch-specific uracil-DNA glycosylase [Oribacterium sp. KHPX15]|uniref:DNA-deoxyinosine glycosylase n=1 Tax=Oribacterium sp. KHPX15 TaxID=1855342 RepID=UPI00089BC511|nr:DNA-deoxyinosine glycosylase [Oribacterium sp. KHPX15]SEA38558.1 G/U mismatch-specific uracil-DNA glycosylase [Oribacterium sp. KHPX15]